MKEHLEIESFSWTEFRLQNSPALQRNFKLKMRVQINDDGPINQKIILSKQENWWEEEVVQYGFNFPSVGVYLDRLMGTNVVQMTDPKFMLELRDRVWSDYDTKLTKRIKDREIIENEREAKLLLKGIYSSYNRPRKFIPFHSIVLALDLGSRKNFKTKSSNVENVSPIFRINERTNDAIDRRRLKMKSVRQRNVDYVLQQTLLEGLQPNIEHDELTAIESKIKEMQNKICDKKSKASRKAPIRKSRKKLPDLLDHKI